MKAMAARDAKNGFGHLIDIARAEPVIIHKHGRPVVVMVAVVPSAIVLSFVAKGGWPSTVGFVMSAGLTAVAMVRSVRCARARRVEAHRRWAWHVGAQLSVALSSRAILRLTFDTDLDPTVAYWVSLWGPMIFGVVAVEILTRTPQGSSSVEPSR